MSATYPATQPAPAIRDARARTLELVEGLSGDQLMGPKLEIVNPLLWEIGHLAWFQERWVLRHLNGRQPIMRNGDELYDSSAVDHDLRWDLPLPSLAHTLDYMRAVLEAVVANLEGVTSERELYFYLLAIYHEDMHDEAFTYSRQILGYPRPRFAVAGGSAAGIEQTGPLPGDAEVPGGSLRLGAEPTGGFVFDNEQWAHRVEVKPFRIARAPVTNEEYGQFVDAGGYGDKKLWSEDGWRWRETRRATHPYYWRRHETLGWEVRCFDRWLPLAPFQPVVHVSWHEAQAYCRWADRRLPTEMEWELAAAGEQTGDDPELKTEKRRFPWGDGAPTPELANLDGAAMGCLDVAARPAGDSAFGCRQMIGNVWEWTSSDFGPFPGFEPGPYQEYSEPWFGSRKVLRGGSWATRGRIPSNTYRNFFTPDRNDLFAGFRTCTI